MNYKILFPCESYNIKEIDSSYKKDKNISYIAGITNYMFDYESFVNEDKFISNIDFTDDCTLIYRGWQLKPDQYTRLNNMLIMKSTGKIELINTPKQYELFHCFPNIYPSLHTYTPQIRVLTKYEKDSDFEDLLRNIPYDFFIKDFVKSAKTKFGVEKISKTIKPEELKNKIMDFLEERVRLFTGGIVLKEFVKLKKYFTKTNEWRAFIFNEKVISLTQNSNLDINIEPPKMLIKTICEKLRGKTNFYTVDFGELVDSTWMVIETGDGQVSDIPQNDDQKILEFYTKIVGYENII